MGYTTDFEGSFRFSRPLTKKEAQYIRDFSGSRRMQRDPEKLKSIYKGEFGRLGISKKSPAVEIYGPNGEFFARPGSNCGQDHDASIMEYNEPPGALRDTGLTFDKQWAKSQKHIAEGKCQPGLWCQWVPNDAGTELEWDGSEKFYEYVAWLQYLIDNFFTPWGVTLTGDVMWVGEDSSDRGKIVVNDSKVSTKKGRIVFA